MLIPLRGSPAERLLSEHPTSSPGLPSTTTSVHQGAKLGSFLLSLADQLCLFPSSGSIYLVYNYLCHLLCPTIASRAQPRVAQLQPIACLNNTPRRQRLTQHAASVHQSAEGGHRPVHEFHERGPDCGSSGVEEPQLGCTSSYQYVSTTFSFFA